MTAADKDVEYLRSKPEFRDMPDRIQAWIAQSPTAAAGFADFFKRGGVVEDLPDVGLPYYWAAEPPRIFVEASQWQSLQANDAPAWPQRHLFGTLAHEIGHHRYNTGSVPFHGRTADEYVQYRAGLEAQAIFNAFAIFKELEGQPEFAGGKPFGSIGYLNEVELGSLYGEWKAGRLGDTEAVERIAAKVANAPYTLARPPQDMDGNGAIAHRDAYLRDYARYIEPKLQPQSSTDPAAAPLGPHDAALLDRLRAQVRELDRLAGKGWDEQSERLSASALVMAKECGFTAQDELRLVFNRRSDDFAAGTLLHLSRQGANASPDPYANRAHMPVADALAVPAAERCEQARAVEVAQAQQPTAAQPQAVCAPDDPGKTAAKLPA
ncbi:XVIPCD domain-containing protein [Lysobacter yananisis]